MNVYVKFIGDGPMRSEFQKMALSFEVADYIEFTGLLSGVTSYQTRIIGGKICLFFPQKEKVFPEPSSRQWL